MKISVIAESKTSQGTIDQLVDEVPELFPKELGVELVYSGERYEVKRNDVWYYDKRFFPELEKVDGMQYRGRFWFNVRPLIKEHRSSSQDEAILMVAHRNFVNLAAEHLSVYSLVGVAFGAHHVCKRHYNGRCYDEDKAIVLGIPDEAHSNNVKVGAHEIAHLYLDKVPKSEKRDMSSDDHCMGGWKEKPCLMSPPQTGPFGVTREAMSRINLGFCHPCLHKLNLAAESYNS